jgi:uncharacterized protein
LLKPRRFPYEVDPGPVQIQARKVHFDVSASAVHWIPGHPVASNLISLLNIVLPAAERWFVTTFEEALPLVRDPRLADDMRGFIGQEATHADVHEKMLDDLMVAGGVDPAPILAQVEFIFGSMLAPTTSTDPRRRLNDLCDRLWLIAAVEHYTAVLGDFALNSSWDEFGADPTVVDVFRWHGSEEVEHRCVAHDVAVYFHDSYADRIRSMVMAASMMFMFFERGMRYLTRVDPGGDLGWRRMQRARRQDAQLNLLPKYRRLFGTQTLTYFRPGYSPEHMGSTAQAVAYLASSPAARAAHA